MTDESNPSLTALLALQEHLLFGRKLDSESKVIIIEMLDTYLGGHDKYFGESAKLPAMPKSKLHTARKSEQIAIWFYNWHCKDPANYPINERGFRNFAELLKADRVGWAKVEQSWKKSLVRKILYLPLTKKKSPLIMVSERMEDVLIEAAAAAPSSIPTFLSDEDHTDLFLEF